MASASAATCTPQTKLLMSFTSAPLPTGPSNVMVLLIAAKTGRAFSSVAAVPPTRKLSSPAAAWIRLPVTGASRNPPPWPATAVASSFTQATVTVLDSITTAPGSTVVIAPLAPSHRLREAASSATMLMITSAFAAAAAGVSATRTPRAASGAALAGLRL